MNTPSKLTVALLLGLSANYASAVDTRIGPVTLQGDLPDRASIAKLYAPPSAPAPAYRSLTG